jgi:hypothetical protein
MRCFKGVIPQFNALGYELGHFPDGSYFYKGTVRQRERI